MDAQKEWTEICQLRRKIEEAGFKKREFHYATNNIQKPDEKPLEFCTHMRIHHSKKPVPFKENLDRQSTDVVDSYEIVDAFLQKIAELIWWHNQRKNPDFYRAVFEQDEWDLLEGLRQQLEALPEKGYSQKALSRAVELIVSLEQELRERQERFRNSKDYKYFHQENQLSHPWIDRENEVIRKIKSLYRKDDNRESDKRENPPLFDWPVSDRKIISNMAIVFAATDFWEDYKDVGHSKRIAVYSERLKKRIQKLDHTPIDPPEMFDPPDEED